jgi:peptide/nickel transport system permease protein
MILSPRLRPETRERIRHEYGLDRPVWFNLEASRETGNLLQLFDSQFFHYVRNLAGGNLGESFRLQTPVAELIRARLGPTLLLILTGEVMAILLGSLLGLVAAWKRKTPIDAVCTAVGLTAFGLPAFWLGIVLLILARGHLPMGGFQTSGVTYADPIARALDVARHLVLPTSTLAILLFGGYMLMARNSSLEVLAEDYILTAKAKGLSAVRILLCHALKNASLPLVTLVALNLGYALGGTIQIETVFSWPGIGRLMYEAIAERDYPILQGVFLFLAVGVIGANFLADLTYALVDPRVKA